ncbi:MAG: DUF4339 domain-containing protein [Nitrospira sp.]|nr:DUF4339 domain-containing protein [Nitrospira sp.]
MDWQKIYQRKPDTIEKYVLESFHNLINATSRIHIFPDISSTIYSGAKSTYLKPQLDELLIAIFDETSIMRHAKDGFAFTTKRIYWRNINEEPKAVEYSKLIASAKIGGFLKNKIELGAGNHIEVINNKEKNEAIIQFINRIKTAYVNGIPMEQSSNASTVWYISISGSQFGPYEINAIKGMLASGQIVPSESFAWRQGMTDWQPFLQTPELEALIPTAPPQIKTSPTPPPKATAEPQSFMSLDDALDAPTIPKTLQNEKDIDLNSATIDELLKLPGINLSGAQKIVEERTKLRGFSTFEEIGHLLNLQPHQVERLKIKALLKTYKGSSTSAGKRVIDF